MMLSESFTRKVGRNGVVPMPADGELSVGGHAMLIVGYDIKTKMYLVRNSWGKRWGDRGYCHIPFAMVDNPMMSWDFWIVRSIEEPEVGYEIDRPDREEQRGQISDWLRRLRAATGWLAGKLMRRK